MSRFLVPCAVSLVLAACVDHSKVSRLDEVGFGISVKVGDGPASMTLVNYGACPTVDAVATMDGKSLSQVEQGGEYTGYDGTIPPHLKTFCAAPEWRLPSSLPDEPVTELAIQDDTGRLMFGIANLGVPRSLSWLSPASGEVRWGDLISVQWTPATDRPEGIPRLTSADRDMIFNRVDYTPEYSREEGVLTFRLPEAPPDQGSTAFDGQLQMTSGINYKVYAGVDHCEPGPDSCGAEIAVPDGTYSVPVTIR